MGMTQPCKEVESLSQESAYAAEGFVTSNSRMLRILDITRRVAQTDVPILILGESGVGKDVLANYIHRHSDRRGGPYVRVNCAALPNELLESELFGYDQGAFTAACARQTGQVRTGRPRNPASR